METAVDSFVPVCVPANTLFGRQNKVKTNCCTVDALLHGGFITGTVNELCGEDATGKTQLCLQTAVTVSLTPAQGGLFGSTLWVQAGGPFPARRLRQLSMQHVTELTNPLDDVKVTVVNDVDELLRALYGAEQVFLEGLETPKPFRLLVLDCLTSLMRTEFEHSVEGMWRRKKFMFKISNAIHRLAHEFNVCILLTNEVSDVVFPQTTRGGNYKCIVSSGRQVCPALGVSWSEHLNNRFFVTKEVDTHGNIVSRSMLVQLSPNLPPSHCAFHITQQGVVSA